MEFNKAAATSISDSAYFRAMLIVLFALTLFRFWAGGHLELAGDEAYYWMWSKHPDLAYFSKPPGVALLIKAGTALLGDTERGVRVFNSVLSLLSGWGLFLLGSRLISPRVGFWSIILIQLAPIFWAGGLLMTIDAPLICAWIWAANALWMIDRKPGPGPWLGLATALAVGMLFKWTMVGFLATVIWWWASDPVRRRHFRSPGFALVLVFLILSLAPVLYWNHFHDYITFDHLRNRGALDRPWQFSVTEWGEYLGGQFGIAGPWLVVPFVIALVRASLRDHLPAGVRTFLVAFFAPLFLFYSALALNDAGQPNWTAAAWLGAALFAVAAWLPWIDAEPRRRRGVLWGLVVVILLAVSFHVVALFVPFEREKELFERQRGHRDLALQAQTIVHERALDFVIGQHYQTASLMAFYWPEPMAFFTPPSPSPPQSI